MCWRYTFGLSRLWMSNERLDANWSSLLGPMTQQFNSVSFVSMFKPVLSCCAFEQTSLFAFVVGIMAIFVGSSCPSSRGISFFDSEPLRNVPLRGHCPRCLLRAKWCLRGSRSSSQRLALHSLWADAFSRDPSSEAAKLRELTICCCGDGLLFGIDAGLHQQPQRCQGRRGCGTSSFGQEGQVEGRGGESPGSHQEERQKQGRAFEGTDRTAQGGWEDCWNGLCYQVSWEHLFFSTVPRWRGRLWFQKGLTKSKRREFLLSLGKDITIHLTILRFKNGVLQLCGLKSLMVQFPERSETWHSDGWFANGPQIQYMVHGNWMELNHHTAGSISFRQIPYAYFLCQLCQVNDVAELLRKRAEADCRPFFGWGTFP